MIYEKEKRYIIPFDDVPSARAKMPEISVEERRGNFKEVELGFPEDVAIKEAKRCLSCRRCLGCALCWAECKAEAIDFSMQDEELELEFDEIIITAGQDNAFYPIKEEFKYGIYPNVITDIKFERMLSETGPTDGLIMSPLNGEIPRRIAFIQSYSDEDHLLSSLIYGVNEAIISLHRVKDMEAFIVSPLCPEFKEKYLDKVKQIERLKLIDANAELVEKSEDGKLKVFYSENGDKKEIDLIDLVVVLTKPRLSDYYSKLQSQVQS